MFRKLVQPEIRAEAPALHRKFCGRALKAVGGKFDRACEEREDALDRFLEELDGSVAQCSEQLREGLLGFEQLHGTGHGLAPAIDVSTAANSTPSASSAAPPPGAGPNAPLNLAEIWAKAKRDALDRAEDGEIDCPICFQGCDLKGPGAARVELLSCSHVFHRCCVDSFESFHVFETHICPVCRQKYDRRPWHQPAASSADSGTSRSALQGGYSAASLPDGIRPPRGPPRAPQASRRSQATSVGNLLGMPAGRSRPPRLTGRAVPDYRVLHAAAP